MRQKLLCSAVLFIVMNICKGQLSQSGTNIAVSSTFYPNIIMHTIPPGPVYSSASTTNARIMWLEYGDGGFTTDPATTRDLVYTSVNTLLPNNPLLLVNRLYDTTKDNYRVYSQTPFQSTTTQARTSDNDFIMITGNPTNSVRLTPSSYDIVKKDTMCFALTYKLVSTAPSNKYFIVFRYNSNVFQATGNGLSGQPNPIPTFTLNTPSQINIPFIRTHHSETAPSSGQMNGITSFLGSNNNYTNGTVAKLDVSQLKIENNWFITLITKSSLATGNSTGVNAQLIQLDSTGVYTTLANYSIQDMMVNEAHDPNYITQSPVCMQLPKTVRNMQYHIHFQNTGRGPADIVKITANLPFGLNLSTCQLDRIVYSGHNYIIGTNNDGSELDTTLDQFNNKIIFTLYKTSATLNDNNLEGTDDVYNPAVNPETMGDIYFTISTTVSVPYSLPAQALIEFHSKLPNRWESSVATNIAVSNYSNCCDCNLFDCDEKGNGPNIKKAAAEKNKPD